MSLDPAEVFNVMQCAYRNGVLDKFMVIQGEALEGVIAETGMNMGDLLNRLDEADEATVMKIDRLLDRAGPLMKYLDSDGLMKLASRLLDIALVKKMMVKNMKATMARAATGTKPPSLGERLRALAGKAA
ncbi:MAG: hypothetical protein JW854_00430 [Actinobacteria bacterium]|nr:hypothetical protein [Actinomycetota bacterium]